MRRQFQIGPSGFHPILTAGGVVVLETYWLMNSRGDEEDFEEVAGGPYETDAEAIYMIAWLRCWRA